MSRSNKLADFADPPVVEVIASVQFEPLKISIPQLGLWANSIRNRYPHLEERPALEPRFEDFGPPQPQRVQLELLHGVPRARLWFMNRPNGEELLQLQSDRLIVNWRGHETDEPYPRYESVRSRFSESIEEFQKFLRKHRIGQIAPNQVELSYINHIDINSGWRKPSEICSVFNIFNIKPKLFDDTDLDNLSNRTAYIVRGNDGNPFARIHIIIERRFYTKKNEPLIYFEITMRGFPQDAELSGLLSFMDDAHSRIVNTFDMITSKKMHRIWRKSDA